MCVRISVPRDLSVVGFDDLAEAATSSPALTTLHNPLFEGGIQAIEFLVKLLDGQAVPDSVGPIPNHLVLRQSTAPSD